MITPGNFAAKFAGRSEGSGVIMAAGSAKTNEFVNKDIYSLVVDVYFNSLSRFFYLKAYHSLGTLYRKIFRSGI